MDNNEKFSLPTDITEEEVKAAIEKDKAEENPVQKEAIPPKEEVKEPEVEETSDESLDNDDEEESIANDSKQIPLAKFQKEKKKWKQQLSSLQAEFDELKSKPAYEDTTTNNVKTLENLSKKYDVSADFLKELYGIIPKSSLSQDDALILREIKEERAKTKKLQEQEKIYNSELSKLQKDFSDIDFSLVNTAKLKELKTQYPTTPLDILFRANKDDLVTKPGRKTLEESSSMVIDESLDFDKMSDEEILNLKTADYEKFLAYNLAKESKFKKIN